MPGAKASVRNNAGPPEIRPEIRRLPVLMPHATLPVVSVAPRRQISVAIFANAVPAMPRGQSIVLKRHALKLGAVWGASR